MSKIQEIVAVNLGQNNSNTKQIPTSATVKPKIALRIKHAELDLTVYNGCDKYILYTALKELNTYAR
ncbi:hypothetical protein NOQ75_002093 [Enterococcus faecalis]|nr:hypothetical protein [Enterococcus faecalis]ELT8951437.1 hypothetical protein [Enterococcus faecalis]